MNDITCSGSRSIFYLTLHHKPGDFRVRSGVPNPERDAEERKYPIKCGYLCFPASGLDADKK